MPSKGSSKVASSKQVISSDAEANVKREYISPDINSDQEQIDDARHKVTGKGASSGKSALETPKRPSGRATVKNVTISSNKRPRDDDDSVISVKDSSDDEGARSTLADDDSPYIAKTKAVPPSIKAKKALLPQEPALTTRGSARAHQASQSQHVDIDSRDGKREPETERALKKKRPSPEEDDTVVDVTPTPSRVKGKDSASVNVGFLTDMRSVKAKDKDAVKNVTDSAVGGSNTKVDSSGGNDDDDDEHETFGNSQWFNKSDAVKSQEDEDGSGPAEVLLEDLYLRRVQTLPETCEVHDPIAEDTYLASQGLYTGLHPLKLIYCYPHKVYAGGAPAEETGLIVFSKWAEYCPGLRVRVARSVIAFQRDDIYVNLSRVDPRDLIARPGNHQNTMFELCVWKQKLLQPAICLSPVAIRESFTQTPHNSLKTYMVSGRFHKVEFDRYIAALGMLMGVEEIGVRLYGDIVTFSVYSPTQGSKVANINNPEDSKFLTTMLDASPSRARSSRTRTGVNSQRVDKIPVYDCRKGPFVATAEFFSDIATRPRFDGEIPPYSFALVAYTTQFRPAHTKAQGWFAYHHPVWVAVLGTRSD